MGLDKIIRVVKHNVACHKCSLTLNTCETGA